MKKPTIDRRRFLGAAAAASLPASGRGKSGGRPGPHERIRVGAIGVGGRASLLLEQLPDEAQIVALCDCNLPRAESFKTAKKRGIGPSIKTIAKSTARISTQ